MVSVCCITYMHADFIKDTIEAVLMQEVDYPIEFIIADDCSPDNTSEIVLNYIDKHPKGKLIKYSKHSENKGMMQNFIWALQQCNGKYIALCEGDDYWTDPLKLQKQVDFLEKNNDYVACFHDVKVVNTEGFVVKENKFSTLGLRDYDKNLLLHGRVIPTLANMFRNVLNEIPEEFKNAALGDKFLCSILGNYGPARYLSDIKPAVYRVGNHGVWSQQESLHKKKLNLITIFYLWRYYDRVGNKQIADDFFKNLLTQGYKLLPYTASITLIEKVEKVLILVNFNFFKSIRKIRLKLMNFKIVK